MGSSSDEFDNGFDEILGGRKASRVRRVVAIASAAALVLASVSVLAGMRDGASEEDLSSEAALNNIYSVWPPDLPRPPLPSCRCQGYHGQSDAYKQDASPTSSELCMSPWGGRYTPCYPLGKADTCAKGAMKCSTVSKEADGAAEEVDSNHSNQSAGADVAVEKEQPCLCVFDIDRTLTAKQLSWWGQCPNTRAVYGAVDNAYGRGTLTLATAASDGLAKTACGKCYVGVCSHGSAGDFKEKEAIVKQVLNTDPFVKLAEEHADAKKWSWGIHIPHFSPITIGVADRLKQWSVEGILHWYALKNVSIPRNRVWFFDDRADNANNFEGTGFHSRQISCKRRDRNVGLCGATKDEIELIPGNFDCHHMPTDADRNAATESSDGEVDEDEDVDDAGVAV